MVRDIGRCRPILSHNSLLERIAFFSTGEDKPTESWHLVAGGDVITAEVHALNRPTQFFVA